MGCLHLTNASFNHPFLFWKKSKQNKRKTKKKPNPNKIYRSITITANIQTSSPNKKSSRNIPRDKIPSSIPLSATLEASFNTKNALAQTKKEKKLFLFQVFFFKKQFSILLDHFFTKTSILPSRYRLSVEMLWKHKYYTGRGHNEPASLEMYAFKLWFVKRYFEKDTKPIE